MHGTRAQIRVETGVPGEEVGGCNLIQPGNPLARIEVISAVIIVDVSHTVCTCVRGRGKVRWSVDESRITGGRGNRRINGGETGGGHSK